MIKFKIFVDLSHVKKAYASRKLDDLHISQLLLDVRTLVLNFHRLPFPPLLISYVKIYRAPDLASKYSNRNVGGEIIISIVAICSNCRKPATAIVTVSIRTFRKRVKCIRATPPSHHLENEYI